MVSFKRLSPAGLAPTKAVLSQVFAWEPAVPAIRCWVWAPDLTQPGVDNGDEVFTVWRHEAAIVVSFKRLSPAGLAPTKAVVSQVFAWEPAVPAIGVDHLQ